MVWGVTPEGQIQSRDGVDGAWEDVASRGDIAHVAVASGSELWATSTSGQVSYRSGSGGEWHDVEGQMKQVSLDADGTVWGIDDKDVVYHSHNIRTGGSWKQGEMKLKQVAASRFGLAKAVGELQTLLTAFSQPSHSPPTVSRHDRMTCVPCR